VYVVIIFFTDELTDDKPVRTKNLFKLQQDIFICVFVRLQDVDIDAIEN
jgi:hypothetical protein